MNFSKTLSDLGGIDRSIEKTSSLSKIKNSFIYDRLREDHPFIEFITDYTPFQFKENICCRITNVGLRELFGEDTLSVDIFYSFDSDSKFSAIDERKFIEDDLPNDLHPFCSDGNSGDFFCVGTGLDNMGKIFFYWHDGPDDRIFSIFDSFIQFMESLEVSDQKSLPDYDESINIPPSKEVSDQILEWKRKNGLL